MRCNVRDLTSVPSLDHFPFLFHCIPAQFYVQTLSTFPSSQSESRVWIPQSDGLHINSNQFVIPPFDLWCVSNCEMIPECQMSSTERALKRERRGEARACQRKNWLAEWLICRDRSISMKRQRGTPCLQLLRSILSPFHTLISVLGEESEEKGSRKHYDRRSKQPPFPGRNSPISTSFLLTAWQQKCAQTVPCLIVCSGRRTTFTKLCSEITQRRATFVISRRHERNVAREWDRMRERGERRGGEYASALQINHRLRCKRPREISCVIVFRCSDLSVKGGKELCDVPVCSQTRVIAQHGMNQLIALTIELLILANRVYFQPRELCFQSALWWQVRCCFSASELNVYKEMYDETTRDFGHGLSVIRVNDVGDREKTQHGVDNRQFLFSMDLRSTVNSRRSLGRWTLFSSAFCPLRTIRTREGMCTVHLDSVWIDVGMGKRGLLWFPFARQLLSGGRPTLKVTMSIYGRSITHLPFIENTSANALFSSLNAVFPFLFPMIEPPHNSHPPPTWSYCKYSHIR